MSYTELLPRPDPSSVNIGLKSPSLAALRDALGAPRDSYTGDCQPVTGAKLRSRIVTRSVGPFRVTGFDLAVESLKGVLDSVKREIPDLHAILGTAGMTCARKVKLRQPDGSIKLGRNPSNHSFGLAIDITLSGKLDRQGDKRCYRGLLILSKYFNAAGWYWGVSFPTEDAMHFEVSSQLLGRWKKDGKL